MDINECASLPCANGATCNDFVSVLAATDVTHCLVSTVKKKRKKNSLSLMSVFSLGLSQVSGYNCTCPAGWSGVHCQYPINECASSPCQSGGTCTDHEAYFTCECVLGYAGRLQRQNFRALGERKITAAGMLRC